MIIFLIGPGGVGKTTTGKIMAEKLGYDCIDLDECFMTQVGHIGEYIHQGPGYLSYIQENSALFYRLLGAITAPTIFILSSGFLVYENQFDLCQKHWNSIQEHGKSILLLPDRSIEISTQIVVDRQLSRGFGLTKEKEIQTFTKRFIQYQQFGDYTVYASGDKNDVANECLKTVA